MLCGHIRLGGDLGVCFFFFLFVVRPFSLSAFYSRARGYGGSSGICVGARGAACAACAASGGVGAAASCSLCTRSKCCTARSSFLSSFAGVTDCGCSASGCGARECGERVRVALVSLPEGGPGRGAAGAGAGGGSGASSRSPGSSSWPPRCRGCAPWGCTGCAFSPSSSSSPSVVSA
eukprot:3931769-Rhodomonas_salina.2